MSEQTSTTDSIPEKDNQTYGRPESDTFNGDGLNKKPSAENVKIMFRGGLSGFLGFMISGLISGGIEGAEPGFSTEFGSVFSFVLSGVLMIAFFILLTYVGPFKK